MPDITSNYVGYKMKGLPPGVFGEAYIVIANTSDFSGGFSVEYYILTQRPQESLRRGSIKVFAGDLPAELGVVDAEFAISEGVRQAEIDILKMLEERSAELGRPDVALLPFETQKCKIPFVGCRMRGQFLLQFEDIWKYTKCPALSRYMDLLQQVRVMT